MRYSIRQLITLNGNSVSMEGYNIEGSTYFKLRDIADAVGGFSVDFKSNTIVLETSQTNAAGTPSVSDASVYDVDELGNLLDTRSVYLYNEGGLLYGKYDQCEDIKTDYEYGVKYGDLTILSSKASEGIVQISTTNPKTFPKKGIPLDKNEKELIALLGEAELGGWEQGIYYLTFLCDGYSLSVKFNDPAKAPYEIIVHF